MSFKSLGSDMEVFARNKDGHHIAICGKIGGTKEEPKPIQELGEGYFIQEDNVALEFNIPICVTKEQFVASFSNMRIYTSNLLKTFDLTLSDKTAISFDKKELVHPNAHIFGCEPDYDVWKKVENKTKRAKDKSLRSCGGHVHVGSSLDMITGVRNMDLRLGIASVILDNSPESLMRKELYGKAGAFRPKYYGWEYRTLGNFWMFSDELVGWVFDRTVEACENPVNITEKEGKEIQDCINTGNKEKALHFIDKYNIILPEKDK